MATLSITRNYADGEVLLEADLDEICDDVEAFLNSEQLGDANIADASITASDKLIDSSVSTAKLAASAVTTAKINDLAVTTAKIAANAVTDAKIQSGGLTASGLATDSVTSDKIAANNVTAGKLANGAVDVAARLANSVVETAKINDGAVTPAKRSTAVYATALTAGPISTSGVASCTITVSARPVLCILTFDGSATTPPTMDNSTGILRLYKNGSLLAQVAQGHAASQFVGWHYVDTALGSGSTTYDLRSDTANTTISGGNLKLTVMEL